jgi:hypothetical protein
MEQFSKITAITNQRTSVESVKQTSESNSATYQNRFSENPRELYRLKVLEILNRVFVLANRPLVNAEMNEASEVWRDTLFDVVPLNSLKAAFDRAIKNHKSSFAVNAFDLLNAWRELEAEEAAEVERLKQIEKDANRVQFCDNRKQHINADGSTLVCNPFNFNEEIEMPCMYCRPQAFADARLRFIKKHGEPKPLEIVGRVAGLEEPA